MHILARMYTLCPNFRLFCLSRWHAVFAIALVIAVIALSRLPLFPNRIRNRANPDNGLLP